MHYTFYDLIRDSIKDSAEQMCTLRYILLDFRTSSATATAPSVQQEKELPLLRTGLVYRTKIYISDIGM